MKYCLSQYTLASIKFLAVLIASLGITVPSAMALTFDIPSNSNIVGEIQHVTVQAGDTLANIGQQYNIGGYEMVEANPKVSFLFPEPGTQLVIPSQFILPPGPRQGIVVNLSEMRLYFYHPNGKQVSTYPVGIGKDGWHTPIGKTEITRMRTNPTWVVPQSILDKHAKNGKILPATMPPGPKNPLGRHAISLGFSEKSIVIDGTPNPQGVGIRSSHGCIRMYAADIERLYSKVKVGDLVTVIHKPNKIGYIGQKIYLEAHVPLSEDLYKSQNFSQQAIQRATKLGLAATTGNLQQIKKIKNRASGIPEFIGYR